MKKLNVFLITLFLIILFSRPRSALAHAILVRSEPADGTIIKTSPENFRLWFSETISPKFSSVQVLAENGRPLGNIVASYDSDDPTLMIIELPPLEDGAYSILWRVLSTSDGHFTQGLVVFGLGEEADLGQAVATTETPGVPWPEVVLRWLNYSFLLGIFGGLTIVNFVIKGEDQPETVANILKEARRRIWVFVGVFAVLAFLIALVWATWQGYTLQQNSLPNSSIPQAAWEWLTQTRLGILWSIRQGLIGILAAAIYWMLSDKGDKRPFSPSLLILIGIVIIISQSLTSHAAALTTNTILAVVADTLHLLSASLWVGGLFSLIIGLLPLVYRNQEHSVDLLKAGWRPFGQFAALSVGLLFVTGLYSVGRQVVSLDALLATPYGQTIMAKSTFFLVIGLTGGMNAMLLHPRLAAWIGRLFHRPDDWRIFNLNQLPKLMLFESTIGLTVILLTGLLTASPTAQGQEFQPVEESPSTLSQVIDDLFITLTVKPNQPGQNVITIRAVSQRKPAPAEILRVLLRLNYQGQDFGIESVVAEEVEPGYYLIGGNQLNLSGSWQIDVVVRRNGLEDSVARFDWTVTSGMETRPEILSNYPWEPILTLAAAAFIFLFLGITFVNWRMKPT